MGYNMMAKAQTRVWPATGALKKKEEMDRYNSINVEENRRRSQECLSFLP